MSFDFDTPLDRRRTDSQKWQKYDGRDILPLWVADMDFRSPPPVIEALQARVAQGIFGYARPTPATTQAVVDYLARAHGWTIDPAWLVWLPGLVVGLNLAAEAFAAPGEEVLAFTPVYPPFMTAPKNCGRVSRPVPLRLVPGPAGTQAAGRWEIDWDALEAAVTPQTKVFFLCHPHNPVGRVWRRDELERLGAFCTQHGLLVCSDEIHCDLILEPALKHVPLAVAVPELAARSVTFIAPSKTYNVPGLGTSLAIIPDPALRAQFNRMATGVMAEVTCLGFTACEAALREGEPWRQALLTHLRRQRARLLEALAHELPGVVLEAPLEATYLAWLNVRALGLADPIAHFEAHGVGLTDGAFFGGKRGDYVRINLGCTRATLDEALRRMQAAIAAARKAA